jgi:hypothetical protein
MIKEKKIVSALINAAEELGLGNIDINNSIELLDNMEYGLAFDTIITQLYEYEIEIDEEFYELIDKSAKKMNISNNSYSFMNELIRGKNKVPTPVKNRLSQILTNLEKKG